MDNRSIHIEFADGSNSYLRYNMTPPEFFKEVKKWQKNYNLQELRCVNSIIYYKATEKGANQNGNEGSTI